MVIQVSGIAAKKARCGMSGSQRWSAASERLEWRREADTAEYVSMTLITQPSETSRSVEQADLDLDSPFPVAAVGSTDLQAP